MSVRKFSFSSLFLLLVSATSTGLTSQAGSAATSQALSYSPVRQTVCGCPQPPGWEKTPNFIYHPTVVCPDFLAPATTVNRTIYCPDFRRVSQSSVTDIQSPLHLAYDPVEREARSQERAQEHAIREHVDRALDTAIEAGKRDLRQNGSPTSALNEAGRSVIRECMSYHMGGGRNRNPE